jgi:hypothetical protein
VYVCILVHPILFLPLVRFHQPWHKVLVDLNVESNTSFHRVIFHPNPLCPSVSTLPRSDARTQGNLDHGELSTGHSQRTL